MYIPKFIEDKELGGLNIGGFLIVLGLAIIIVILIVGGIAWKLSSRECHIAEQQYHKHTHYIFLGGECYIETEPGIKIGLEQFQNFKQVK